MPTTFKGNQYKISLNELPEEAWQTIIGSSDGDGDPSSLQPRVLYELNAWLYRATELRAGTISSCPYTIVRASTGKEFYDSDGRKDLPPNLSWMDGFRALMMKTEQATILGGAGYWRKDLIKGLTWMVPYSVKPKYEKGSGALIGFKREANGGGVGLRVEDVIYFWPPDYMVEIGPAKNFPARAAVMDASTLYNQNFTLQAYYKRGGVPITLMRYSRPLTPQEQEAIGSWWQRVARGVKNSFAMRFLREDLTFDRIGDKPDEYYSPKMVEQMRKSVMAALGVPETKFVQSGANLATREQDERSYIEDTIRPRLDWYEEVLNAQLFAPLGYRIQFKTERLAAMQEDEEQRSDSLAKLVGAGMPLAIALRVLGYSLENEDMDAINAMAARPAQPEPPTPIAMPPDTAMEQAAEVRALRNWAKKRVKEGKGLVGFVPEHLTAEQVKGIVAEYAEGETTLNDDFFIKANAAQRVIISMERPMVTAMLPILQSIPSVVLKAYESGGNWRSALDTTMQEFGAQWTKKTTMAARRGIADGKRFTDSLDTKAVKFDIDWDLPNEEAARWAEQNTAQYLGDLVEGMTAVMADSMAADLALWIREGRALSELLDYWALSYAFSRDRMEGIATTEMTRAYAYGNQAAWEHSGVVWGKQWVTANDERVCPICAPLGGLTFSDDGAVPATIGQQNEQGAAVALDDPFVHPGGSGAAANYAGQPFTLPPAHPRCRCSIAPVVNNPNGLII